MKNLLIILTALFFVSCASTNVCKEPNVKLCSPSRMGDSKPEKF